MDELIEKTTTENWSKMAINRQKLAKIEKYPQNLKKDRIQNS